MGQIAALASALSYALSYCFLRKGQAQATPPDFGLLPVLFISAFALDAVWAIQFAFAEHARPAAETDFTSRGMLWACLSGLTATLCGRLLLYNAIDRLGATRSVILKGISPLATMLTVVIALDQDLSENDYLGLLAVFVAMALLFLERVLHPPEERSIRFFQNAVVIGVAAALLQGIGHAMRQLGVENGLSASVASALDITTACVVYMSLLAVTGKLGQRVKWYRAHGSVWLIAAGLSSSAGVFLFFLATAFLPVSSVAILVATEPLFVTLLSAIFFAKLERPTWWTGVAAITMTASVLFLTR
ncbi:DMT family transporter [Alicyclobacillus acidiphilus]|uniref:DMT family transporter n=1 Tax=Alicyclobacillus acidiphilus TaxID=182455 RepID=UPI000830ACEB|nr:DMT family transporter [Alicyclobacillus acidiphilus]